MLLGMGLVTAFLLGGVLAVAWIASGTIIHPPADKSPYNLSHYEIAGLEEVEFIAQDGVTLRGWFVPGSNGATVVLCHGRGGNREWMLPEAEYLHRAGFSVLLFDFRHRGMSEGNQQTLGAKEAWDIQAAVKYLGGRKDVDGARIGVQGNSMGAVAAILAAAETPGIRGVVGEIPFSSAHAVMNHTYPKLVGLPSFPFAPVTWWLVEMRTGVDYDALNPAGVVNQIKGRPLFLIDNLQDEVFPPNSVELIYEAVEEPKQLWQIDCLHGAGRESQPEEYERRVVKFWRETLGIDR